MSRPLRVLLLLTDGDGCGGGIAAYNHELAAGLQALGVDVRRLCLRGTPGADQTVESSRWRYVLRALWWCWRWRPDWIWCGHINLSPIARLAMLLSPATRMLLQVHGVDAWQPPSRWRRWGALGAQLIASVSRYTRWRVLGWHPIEPEQSPILADTYDPRYVPGPADGRLRQAYGVGEGLVVATVGRMAANEAYKGHDRMLRAMPQVLVQFPNLRYLVAGEGDDRQRLQALADALGIAERVHFVGAVAAADLPELYRSIDLFAMPSTGEGFGIVYLEAMACGTAVLGSGVEGSADPLHDGRLGWCVGERDLATVLIEALRGARDGDLQARAAQRAATVANHFGRDCFRRQLQALLDERLKPAATAP